MAVYKLVQIGSPKQHQIHYMSTCATFVFQVYCVSTYGIQLQNSVDNRACFTVYNVSCDRQICECLSFERLIST